MARAIVLGNGTFFVALDKHSFIRDVHFHYVGLENHVVGHKQRIGVGIDDSVFLWLDDPSFDVSVSYKNETMAGYYVFKNKKYNFSLVLEQVVYNETDVFLRQVDIYNSLPYQRKFDLFFHQVFLIYESNKRNTAFYDPTQKCIIHYKGRRVFLVNGITEDQEKIQEYSVGAYQYDGFEGVYKDAEDLKLSKNAVEHGNVDSVFKLSIDVKPKQKKRIYYWICAGKSLDQVSKLNNMVFQKTPQGMIHSTECFWKAWVQKANEKVKNFISDKAKKLFDLSLFVLRAHTDNRGSIIASGDSEMIFYGKDDYSYMWPRDAAFVSTTFDMAGYTEVTESFFEFCRDVLHPDGYLHHRFNSDRSLGSTWHSAIAQKRWLKDKILQLPIQEDETAGVLYALWKHYEANKNLEFIELLYKPMIEKMADFLAKFIDVKTHLPLPSYDLWEEKNSISTYTCSAVYGGLMAAAKFSELLGKRNHMRRYRDTALKIKKAMIDYLYDKEIKSFIRCIEIDDDDNFIKNKTIDASSTFGLWYFGVLDQDDPLFINTHKKMLEVLESKGPVGGIIRYEGDKYFKDTPLSNPWLITTMWEAQRILKNKNVNLDDLKKVEKTINWVIDNAYVSGVLPEQLDPYTGEAKSATPLVWSHSVYISLILDYVRVYKRLIEKIDIDKDKQ